MRSLEEVGILNRGIKISSIKHLIFSSDRVVRAVNNQIRNEKIDDRSRKSLLNFPSFSSKEGKARECGKERDGLNIGSTFIHSQKFLIL
jgi:hypothetical protein